MDTTVAAPADIGQAPPRRCVRDVVVIGLGNTLLADDGVGVCVVRRLGLDPETPATLRLIDGGTLGFRLLETVIMSDALLLIDAAQLGEPAGTMRLLEEVTLSRYLRRGGRMSAHEAGLVDLLTLARLEGWSPGRLALLGIQPQRIDWDDRLSAAVASSVPSACRMVTDTVMAWRHAA